MAQLFIETVNGLISGWYLTVETFVPCIHCIRGKDYSPCLFPLEDCSLACITGKSFIKCFGIRDIRLDELVPDVAMVHVANCKLEHSEIDIEKEIGEGGFATVFKGTYHDSIVAVKKIKFGSSDESTKEIEAFGEFRREVWIMSGLTHSNIVQMAGFTMDPFCIITEFVGCGNLKAKFKLGCVAFEMTLLAEKTIELSKL